MRFNRLDLNLLVALDALLTERSVTRAAHRLSLSPSATSCALSRLRDYFDDDLLVQVGRKMEATPRAEALQQQVRDVLVRVDSTIAIQPEFDPSTSDRIFRIFASDYTLCVLAPHVMALAAADNCRAQFDFLPQVANPQRDLERGEADLLVLPRVLMSEDHPCETLYEERFVCVLWHQSHLAQADLNKATYLQAGHVLMKPQASSSGTFEDLHVRKQLPKRRVAATSYGFATLPPLLMGTEWVATMHERLAYLLQASWPLAVRPCPVEIPVMEQSLQWHKYRTQDPGILWLRGLFREASLILQNARP